MGKGENVHQQGAMAPVEAVAPASLIILDQGSRAGEPILPGVPTLIVDHHASENFPEGAEVVSSYGHEPMATTSMLAYLLCEPQLAALRLRGAHFCALKQRQSCFRAKTMTWPRCIVRRMRWLTSLLA